MASPVVMRKWQGSAWRTSEAVSPLTSLQQQGKGRGGRPGSDTSGSQRAKEQTHRVQQSPALHSISGQQYCRHRRSCSRRRHQQQQKAAPAAAEGGTSRPSRQQQQQRRAPTADMATWWGSLRRAAAAGPRPGRSWGSGAARALCPHACRAGNGRAREGQQPQWRVQWHVRHTYRPQRSMDAS